MARETNQSNNADFEVIQMPALHPIQKEGESARIIPNLFYNVRKDTEEILGSTTDGYTLVQNQSLMKMAREGMAKVGIENYEESTVVTQNGARIYMSFVAKLAPLKIVGDSFGYKLTVQNSFDKSIRAGVELGFLRLVCTNGMCSLDKIFGSSKKHNGGLLNVDYIATAIEAALAQAPESLKVYESIASVKLDNDMGIRMLENLSEKNIISEKIKEMISIPWLTPRRKEDKPRNLYSLLNAGTEVLTHLIAPHRYEYAQGISSQILDIFHNCKEKKYLDTWLKKPEKASKMVLSLPPVEAMVQHAAA